MTIEFNQSCLLSFETIRFSIFSIVFISSEVQNSRKVTPDKARQSKVYQTLVANVYFRLV